MDNKRKVLRVLHCVLMLISMIVSLIMVLSKDFSADLWEMVSNASTLPALLFAIIYIGTGYRKQSAVFYKLFMIFFLISLAVLLVSMILGGMEDAPSEFLKYCMWIPVALSIIVMIILSAGKNIGEFKTYFFVGLLFLFNLLSLIFACIIVFYQGANIVPIVYCIDRILLALTAGCMTIGKYMDKAERGSFT